MLFHSKSICDIMGKSESKLPKLTSKELNILTSCTHFSRLELKAWYRDFLADCPSGILSKEEFTMIYQQQFPEGDSRQFAEFIFRTFDRDMDENLNFKEFMVALSITSRGSLDEKLDWAFRLYDLDDDGYVSRHEMLCIVASVYAMVRSDDDDDEQDSPDERVSRVFAQMDLDHDGRLSKEEFTDGARMDPWIVQTLTLSTLPRR